MVTDLMLDEFLRYCYREYCSDEVFYTSMIDNMRKHDFEDFDGRMKIFIETDLLAGLTFEEVKEKYKQMVIHDYRKAGLLS